MSDVMNTLDALLNENMPNLRLLVWRQVRSTPYLDYEDLYQTAAVGFCRAYRTWKRGKGSTLRGWCLEHAKHGMHEFHRQEAIHWARYRVCPWDWTGLGDQSDSDWIERVAESVAPDLVERIDMARRNVVAEGDDETPLYQRKEKRLCDRATFGLFSRWG
jgi:DNA-directed RNA polymerase specialized sigma24 family protein